jgi:hypothetical protein
VRFDVEFWKEVRQRVLTGQLSSRAAIKEYRLGWQTLKEIFSQAERPGYRLSQPRAKPKLERFLPTTISCCLVDQETLSARM